MIHALIIDGPAAGTEQSIPYDAQEWRVAERSDEPVFVGRSIHDRDLFAAPYPALTYTVYSPTGIELWAPLDSTEINTVEGLAKALIRAGTTMLTRGYRR